MEITWGGAVALLGVCCSLCSVASFYFGRRKAAADEAREDAKVSLDLKYIKDTVRDQTKSIEALTTKFDAQNALREKEFRELLVKFTALETRHNLVHTEVETIKKEIAMYHHHN